MDESKNKNESIENEVIDYTKYPAGHEALKPMLDFLPNDESKYGLLAGFTLFLSLM